MYISTTETASTAGPLIRSAHFVGAVGEEHRVALLADLMRWAEEGPFRLLLFAEDVVVVDKSLTSDRYRVGRALRQPPLSEAVDRIALVGATSPRPHPPAGGPEVRRFGDDLEGALNWLGSPYENLL